MYEFATEQEHLEAIKAKPFDFKAVQRAQTFAMDVLSKSDKINKKHLLALKNADENLSSTLVTRQKYKLKNEEKKYEITVPVFMLIQ